MLPEDKQNGQPQQQAPQALQQNHLAETIQVFSNLANVIIATQQQKQNPAIHVFKKEQKALEEGTPQAVAQPAAQQAPEPSQPHASLPLPLENVKDAPQKTHEDFEMEALERLKNRKAGTGNTKCLKRPASAKAKPACKAPKVMAKPKAASPALQLGCGKCRGSPVGCLQCRDANFKGNRYTKAQWLALKKHHGYK